MCLTMVVLYGTGAFVSVRFLKMKENTENFQKLMKNVFGWINQCLLYFFPTFWSVTHQ